MKDWNESGIRRRDARQTILPDIRPPGRSAKDTRKWCRGKVGVEHKPVCVAYGELKKYHSHHADLARMANPRLHRMQQAPRPLVPVAMDAQQDKARMGG